MYTSLPPKQGLYDPWFEHDACGLGVVANIVCICASCCFTS